MVTRCICFKKTFVELKTIAKKHNVTTLEELQQYVRFGDNCKRCHPYVKLMLQTGETEFELLPYSDESETTE